MWRSESLLDHWWIAPNNELARERVTQLDQYIRSVSKRTHPLLLFTTAEEQEIAQSLQGASLVAVMQTYNTQVVKILLSKDVEKDLNAELHRNQIHFLKKVRHTFVTYIRFTLQSLHLSLREFMQMFEVIHQFKVLLDMDQYGLADLWKCVIYKCIEFVHEGKYELLLFLFDWIPGMLTREHYINCDTLVEGDLFQSKMRHVCNISPFLASLYEKHAEKFELYFLRH